MAAITTRRITPIFYESILSFYELPVVSFNAINFSQMKFLQLMGFYTISL